jgi:NAD(P)-dependent dehydrogenase (short-subunit alcohol dehydrogenase family)
MRLADKVAVVTGAGSGMGRAMANLFASEGAKIVAAEWNAEALKDVIAEVTAAGGVITGVEGNVALEADCDKIIASAVDTYGRLDVLCNNAGVMDTNQAVGELTNEMWERVLGINPTAPCFRARRTRMLPAEAGRS